MNGVRSETAWKSSMVKSTPTACAMASRCMTALVDPPVALTTVTAFSKALRVMMSDGRMLFSSSRLMAGPTFAISSRFACDTAGLDDEYGSDMPMASTAEAMVLAVYMPPHDPAPGHALWMMSSYAASSILPAVRAPYASNADRMLTVPPSVMESRLYLPPAVHPLDMAPP